MLNIIAEPKMMNPFVKIHCPDAKIIVFVSFSQEARFVMVKNLVTINLIRLGNGVAMMIQMRTQFCARIGIVERVCGNVGTTNVSVKSMCVMGITTVQITEMEVMKNQHCVSIGIVERAE